MNEMGAITLRDLEIPKIRIRVDPDKCLLPMSCEWQCYIRCPQQCFNVYPRIGDPMFKRADMTIPGQYAAHGGGMGKCVGCLICLDKCPENAITLDFQRPKASPEEHPYAHPYEAKSVGWENQKLMEEMDKKWKKEGQ